MATDPLAYFEEQLRAYFDGSESWDTNERMDAEFSYDVADSILDSMLFTDDEVFDYFSALPSWFEFENILPGTVSVRDIAEYAVTKYCLEESEYLAELIENEL